MRTFKKTGIRVLFGLGAVFLAILIVLGAYRLISGKSLGLRSFASNTIAWATNPIKMVWHGRKIAEQNKGDYTNIIFLHHSTGNNLIQQGHLRNLMAEMGYALWDHGYNAQGLRGPEVGSLGYHYNIPNDNPDPYGLIEIFRQPELPLPLNSFSALLQHEVIVYKSCFDPGNKIKSDAQLQQYKDWYIEMRAVMAAQPDRMFVIVTMPPLNPAETNPEEAARARHFAEWLQSEEYLAGQTNIFVIDFFDMLAEDDPTAPDYNMLRAEFRDGDDSHPNRLANETIAPLFAEALRSHIEQFRAMASSAQ